MITQLAWEAWFVTMPDQNLIHYTSIDTAFKDLPKDGCLALVIHEDHDGNTDFRMFIQGRDWYFQAKGAGNTFIYGGSMDINGLDGQTDIEGRYNNPIVIRGAFTDKARLEAVTDAMEATRYDDRFTAN